MNIRCLTHSGALLVALLVAPSPALAQSSLGTAEAFAVLAGSGVTNTGFSVVTGDLGTHPTLAVTGFVGASTTGDGIVIGTIHEGGAVAELAKTDLVTQYNALEAATCTTDLTGEDLGSRTLTPGVYCFSSSAGLTGTLTLDAEGDPDAVFIFQIGSTLTTASGAAVVMDGGDPCGVAWQIGSSATLGTGTSFVGNLIALTSITLNTNANIIGRALARNGAVTMDDNDVSLVTCSMAVPAMPEIATWLLLLTLLGAGAYVLRQRTATEASR